jgi:hypothetical protein
VARASHWAGLTDRSGWSAVVLHEAGAAGAVVCLQGGAGLLLATADWICCFGTVVTLSTACFGTQLAAEWPVLAKVPAVVAVKHVASPSEAQEAVDGPAAAETWVQHECGEFAGAFALLLPAAAGTASTGVLLQGTPPAQQRCQPWVALHLKPFVLCLSVGPTSCEKQHGCCCCGWGCSNLVLHARGLCAQTAKHG